MSLPSTPRSPSHPLFLLQSSPAPTGQVLRDVASNLQTIEAVQNVKPNWPSLEGEEVVEGLVTQAAESLKVSGNNTNQPAIMVNYDQQNEDDLEGAFSNARDCKLPFTNAGELLELFWPEVNT